VFTAKENQPTLLADIRLFFEERTAPDVREPFTLEHGRLESRAIWSTTALNDYLSFPHLGQVFAIERQTSNKKTGEESTEMVYGVTDHTPQSADAARLLAFNRDQWGVEAHHYIRGREVRECGKVVVNREVDHDLPINRIGLCIAYRSVSGGSSGAIKPIGGVEV